MGGVWRRLVPAGWRARCTRDYTCTPYRRFRLVMSEKLSSSFTSIRVAQAVGLLPLKGESHKEAYQPWTATGERVRVNDAAIVYVHADSYAGASTELGLEHSTEAVQAPLPQQLQRQPPGGVAASPKPAGCYLP